MTELAALAEEAFELVLDTDPFMATLFGIRDRDDQLPDLSEEGEEDLRRRCVAMVQRLAATAPASPDEEVTQAAAVWELRTQARVLATRPAELLAHQMAGPQHQVLQWSIPRVTLAEPAHAEQYLQRLVGVPAYLDTAAQRIRGGSAAGRTGVARNIDRAISQIDDGLGTGMAELREVDLAGDPSFAARRDALLDSTVAPALARFREALRDVLPAGRDDEHAGLAHLPGEEETYAAHAERQTSTALRPQRIHEIGRAVVAQVRDELADLGGQVLGVADADAAIRQIRNDPNLRCRSAADIVEVSRAAIERGMAAAPGWFNRLPSAPLELHVMPDAQAEHTPAHYIPPSQDGSRPGRYLVNALNPQAHPQPGVETTAFHEGVPGHHFQLALSMELDLPRIRRFVEGNAYVEGWALYAERLADEMGLFSSDVARLGMLVGESFRACRLVVDTGLHLHGWTRQQAIDYMFANSPLARGDIEAEVDRYIAIPGQALGYMIGRLEVTRLRALAANRPIAEFHDVVLRNGVLPLGVLDTVVTSWLGGSESR